SFAMTSTLFRCARETQRKFPSQAKVGASHDDINQGFLISDKLKNQGEPDTRESGNTKPR
ncbi:MAG TPA: hypothetical protein VK181_11660, partial [Rhizobium sp.]|nr:hypothetical protein [Rhizobium sp.]